MSRMSRHLPWLALVAAHVATAQDGGVDIDASLDAAQAGGSAFAWGALIAGIVVIGILSVVGRRFAATLTLIAGLGLVFIGERLFDGNAMHWVVTGLGVIAVIASLGMRLQSMLSEDDASRRAAQRMGLAGAATAALALVVYALGLPIVTGSLGLSELALERFIVATQVAVPIVLLCGVLPTLFVDRVLSDNPVMVPAQAPRGAYTAGLATALALSLLFPLNYVANATKYSTQVDYSYFRVTDVGTRTLGVVRTLSEPVTATLYFSSGSDVRNKTEPYFRKLAAAADGMISVQVVDHAVRPDLAEEHGIRTNGWVVLSSGDKSQKFEIGTEMDRAKRKLVRLDGTVTKHLLKLTSDAQVAYFLSGHGEANWRDRSDPMRNLSDLKSGLEDLNFSVQPLGITEGSSVDIPEDAALLVIAAPMRPIFPEERAAIVRYLQGGGSLLLMLDPSAAPMPDLLSFLGLSAGQAPIANAAAYIRTAGGGLSDRFIIGTNRFGSHAATKTVSRNSVNGPLGMPGVVALSKNDDGRNEITTLVRSYPDSWEDTTLNAQQDDSEPGKVFDLAVAVEPDGGDGFRAIVIGDVGVFSTAMYASLKANQDFAADVASWLVSDDDMIGNTEREDDVEIVHTRDEDKAWFWGTILGMPLFILALGGIVVNLRRRKS